MSETEPRLRYIEMEVASDTVVTLGTVGQLRRVQLLC